jgi:hypothetical protein
MLAWTTASATQPNMKEGYHFQYKLQLAGKEGKKQSEAVYLLKTPKIFPQNVVNRLNTSILQCKTGRNPIKRQL